MRQSRRSIALAAVLLGPAGLAQGAVIPGGGARTTDCLVVFDAPQANRPAPPLAPRSVDCVDGDPCDTDGLRNGRCSFDLRLCINSTSVAGCTVDRTDSLTVDHAIDNGDPRFDTDFQALQSRADLLGFPDNQSHDKCTISSSLTVPLTPPSNGSGPWKKGRKTVRVTATGFTDRPATDRDMLRFTCRPQGDGIYTPRDLYTGTFDRIAQQVFARSCALSGCHDSNTHQNNMILLPNAAYSQTVGVMPFNSVAKADGRLRIDDNGGTYPGNPQNSFLFLKVDAKTNGTLLPSGYGSGMPLTGQAVSPHLVDIIRLWIVGDSTLGPAPQTGWVAGTDQ